MGEVLFTRVYSRTTIAPRSANEALLGPSLSLTWVKLGFMTTRNRNRRFDHPSGPRM